MKIELYIDTAEGAAAFAEFLPKYQDALGRARERMVREHALIESGWMPGEDKTLYGRNGFTVQREEYSAKPATDDADPVPATPAISRRPAKKKKPAPVEELILPEPEVEAGPEVLAEAAGPEVPAEDAEPVTLEDLRRALRVFGSTKGADALTALYAKFGVQKLSDIPQDAYAEVLAEVNT